MRKFAKCHPNRSEQRNGLCAECCMDVHYEATRTDKPFSTVRYMDALEAHENIKQLKDWRDYLKKILVHSSNYKNVYLNNKEDFRNELRQVSKYLKNRL